VAQSFVPSLYTLSKVELMLAQYAPGDPPPLQIYIRDSLSGDNLAESSLAIPELEYNQYAWYTFDFEDLYITPGNTYYIVCEEEMDWPYVWRWKEDNPYPLGEVYYFYHDEWHSDSADCCFVTWGMKPEYPVVFNPIPEDGDSWISSDISQLSFNLRDYQGDLMDYTVETVPDIGSGSGSGVSNGTYTVDVSDLGYLTNYSWFVNVTDGEHWTNKVFVFKTAPIMVFNPFDQDWQYRKKITINHSKVTGDLSDFPVLINIEDSDLTVKAQVDGDDILFMDGSGVANRLFHEIERYNSSSGELVAWVNVTSLSSSSDTIIYLYYGNPNCGSQQFLDRVWSSDYCGVWHLNDFLDSTVNNNDCTNYGTDNCLGKIGNAKDFVETNKDYISLGDMREPADDSISKATFELWINPEEGTKGNIISKLDTSYEPDRKSYNFNLLDTGQLKFSAFSGTWYQSGKLIRFTTDDNLVTNDNWQYIAVVVDLSNRDAVFYYNGEEKASTVEIKGDPPSHFYNVKLEDTLGKYKPESGGPYFYDGSMDEVRISKTMKSENWILTQYNNQNDPSSFFNVGPEES
jgi:hypothetical protein